MLESRATYGQIHQVLSFSRRAEASGASLTLLTAVWSTCLSSRKQQMLRISCVLRQAPAPVTVIQCLLLLMGNCFTYLWKLFQNFFGRSPKFSAMRLIRYWITATGAGADMESMPRSTPWCSTPPRGSPVMLTWPAEHVCIVLCLRCRPFCGLCVSRRLPRAGRPRSRGRGRDIRN